MSKAEYSFDEDLAHRLKNPAFKKAYDSLDDMIPLKQTR